MRWLLLFAFACTRPAPAPIANTPPPTSSPADGRCVRTLPWAAKTTYFHYSEVQNGHFGNSELHADFNRLVAEDTLHGVVVLTYREDQDKPVKVETLTMTLPASEVAGWLTQLRDRVQEPPDPADARRLVASDSSRSMHMSIEAVPYEAVGGEGSVQFYSEEGETSPSPWHIRGCRSDARHSALKAIDTLVGQIQKRLGRDALIKKIGAVIP